MLKEKENLESKASDLETDLNVKLCSHSYLFPRDKIK